MDDETETGVIFSELQLEYVQRVREAVVVAEAVVEGVAEGVVDTRLDSVVMGLIISLLAQETSQLRLYKSLVMHYLAVRAIDTQTEAFYPLFQYIPFLAHMIWMIRLLLLEMAIPEQGWPELGLQSCKEVGAVVGAVVDRIQTLRKEYLCERSFSLVSSILSQLAFG